MSGLEEHLVSGCTTVCHAWAVRRSDGVEMGFTDHDRDLAFEGRSFKAGTGLTAGALQKVSGLAVDNAEAVGALSDAGISEADLRAGRFDGAEVKVWLVNWADPSMRVLRFRGTLGEVAQEGAVFRAELRGLSEVLNRPMGRVIQSQCDAVLGDLRCGVDLDDPQWRIDVQIAGLREGRSLVLPALDFLDGWFEHGTALFIDGAAAGLSGAVKSDRILGNARLVELWQEPGAAPAAGDHVRLSAGCDRRAESCRGKFGNFLNFRGFPHVPDEDWVAASPSREVAAG